MCKPFSENCVTLLKVFFNLNKWGDIPCSLIGRLNIVAMLLCPKLIYRLEKKKSKISASFSVEIDKVFLKLIWKLKPRITKAIIKVIIGGFTLSDFKPYIKLQ